MKTETFIARCRLPYPAAEVFRWHLRPGAFERLNPPWEPAQIIERSGGATDAGRMVLRVRVGPFRRRWVAQHLDFQPDREFHDRQASGPFAAWDHWHRVEPVGAAECDLEDRIEYALPLGAVGRVCGGGYARRKLRRVFAYRQRVLRQDLDRHALYKEQPRLRVLISGAHGLVGSDLCPFLTTGEHTVTRLARTENAAGADIAWDPATGQIDAERLSKFDAVVHLAGEGIAARRWTVAQKQRIRDSRTVGTRLLCEALARLPQPPKVFVCASAIGFYGDRGDELLDERSAHGAGFLTEVCRDWEAATEPARQAGIRVVNLRFGVILSPRGGALAKMLLPFRLGLGGRIGSGRQYWSWIALDDVIGAIYHALMCGDVAGPVNVVSPTPLTNRDFTATLASVLHRPAIFPLPAPAARLALGEMANELLLASARVVPLRLLDTGYRFDYSDLAAALNHILGRVTSCS